MTDWYDKAAMEIESEFEQGLMSHDEFRQAMRDLNSEYEDYLNDYKQSREEY